MMDLEQVAGELRAAGYVVTNGHGRALFVGINTYERYTKVLRVFDDGAVYCDGPVDWRALDIVRPFVEASRAAQEATE